MSEPKLVGVRVSESQVRAMARGDRDMTFATTGEGDLAAKCKSCSEWMEIAQDAVLVWFRCPKCRRESFYPVGNIQRDMQYAIKDGEPFVTDFFYPRELPASLKSPFVTE